MTCINFSRPKYDTESLKASVHGDPPLRLILSEALQLF